MNDGFLTLWEEPLYRFILQITIAEIGFLGLIILGVIVTRQTRLVREKRRTRVSGAIFEPLMQYLAGDTDLEDVYEALKAHPKRIVCLEFERYTAMLDGRTLARMRALYERLDLRNLGLRLAGSTFWWRRLEGVRLLGATSGTEVVELLLDRVMDPNPVVRLAAVRSLGRIRNARAIRPLLAMLSEAEQMSRRQLAQTLIAFGSDITPFLKRIMVDEMDSRGDPGFLATILEVLALTGDVNCEKEVKLSIVSPHLEVRIAAFKAAGLLHLPLPRRTLSRGLKDDAWQVRAQAALTAGKLGETDVISALGACLSDRNWWVRSNAGTALFQCGPEGAAELERIATQSADPFARDMAKRTLTSDPLYQAFGKGEERASAPPEEQPA